MRPEADLAADCLIPDWPAPPNVRALSTTRAGGVSGGAYASLNLGDHVGDDAAAVAANRQRLASVLPESPQWLTQVHGCTVAVLDAAGGARVAGGGFGDSAAARVEADAVMTMARGRVCGVLTADCLPVLFCDRRGSRVAAAHAGWRGLAAGVLERAVAALGVPPGELIAWMGPAIGPRAFEVGDEVRAAFVAVDAAAATLFVPSPRPPVAGQPPVVRWLADLPGLARRRLHAAGVVAVHGGQWCTFTDAARFFSYRRDGACGRMATLVWLDGARRAPA